MSIDLNEQNLAVIEQLRKKLKNNFGVEVENDVANQTSYVVLRWFHKGHFVDVRLEIKEIKHDAANNAHRRRDNPVQATS